MDFYIMVDPDNICMPGPSIHGHQAKIRVTINDTDNIITKSKIKFNLYLKLYQHRL